MFILGPTAGLKPHEVAPDRLAPDSKPWRKSAEAATRGVYEPSFITVAYKRGVVADWIVAKGRPML